MCLKKYWALALIAGLCCVAGLNSTVSKADDDGAILNPPAANKYQPEDTTNNVGDRNTDRNSRQIFDRINVRHLRRRGRRAHNRDEGSPFNYIKGNIEVALLKVLLNHLVHGQW